MAKPYSEHDLSEHFDTDLAWRRKELSDIKLAISQARQTSRQALLRSLIALSYAHWEGYVRFCARSYFLHIGLKKLHFNRLEKQFYSNTFLVRIEALRSKGMNTKGRVHLIEEILDSEQKRFTKINPKLIDTRSNLNTDVIADICLICGVDGTHFEDKRDLIDRLLVGRRNSIAHGQNEFIHYNEIDSFVADVLSLMEHFRSLVENKAQKKSYLIS